MVKLYLSFALFFFIAFLSNAQKYSPTEAYLEEKVRDPKLREYAKKLIKGLATEADYTLIKEYYENRKNSSSRTESFLQEGAEPHIVIHPTNKNILALSFMQNDLSSADYPIYVSLDAGATWTESSFSTESALYSSFPGTMLMGGGDPILAFDENGTLHFSYIYVHGAFPNLRGDMLYAYSTDTGKTFTVPPLDEHVVYQGNIFASDMLDRQWMDLDNTGGPYDGNLYMSAFYFMGPLSDAGQVVLTKPADSSSFDLDNVATAVTAESGRLTQFGNVKVDNFGNVHVSCAYLDEFDGSGFVYHTVSSDGGKTFSAPTEVGSGELLGPNPQMNPNPVIHDRENAAISLAVDGDNVYLAWTDFGNSESKAYFSYSNDGGLNFSPQFEFGNELLDTLRYHFMPNVSADSGNVTISWYGVDKLTGSTDYFMAESANAGLSFDSVLLVSDASSSFVGGQNAFYGDYNSSVKHGCTVWSVWSDGRSGAPDIYVAKQRLYNSASGTNQPPASATELSPISGDFQVSALWPNPAQNRISITINLSKSQNLNTAIYALDGKLVKSYPPTLLTKGNNSFSIDVNELAPGQYILKTSAESGLFATRLFHKL